MALLGTIWQAVEMSLVLPSVVDRQRTALIPKKDGRWRGIAVFAAALRVYTKAGLGICREWEREHDDQLFSQRSGAAALDPIWRAAVRAEAHAADGQCAAVVAFDVASFLPEPV